MRTALTSVVVFAMFATGCATAPKSQAERRSLVAEAHATLESMIAKDSSLRGVLDGSAGYAVFPDVGTAGAVLGGAYGRGVVFEDGRPVGFAELNQGSVGATIGAQDYSQVIVFHNPDALGRLKAGNFDVGAEASAVALKSGVAAATRSEGGISIFQLPRGGLMASAAVTGQQLNFQPSQESFDDDRQGEAMTAGSHFRANTSASSTSSSMTTRTDTRSGNESSAYRVNTNLQPKEQVQLDTGHDALKDVSGQHNNSSDSNATSDPNYH